MAPTPEQAAVTFDPTVPLHHQIYLHLREEIADGLWSDRTDFPGERELAERYGISVITSRAALDRLAADGWIKRQRGRRPQVTHDPMVPKATTRPVLNPVARYRSEPYRYKVLFAETRTAPAEACAAFGVPPGQQLWQCSRFRLYNGAPHSVTHNAQPPEIGTRHTKRQLERLPMMELLSAQGHTIARMRRRVGIAHAPIGVTAALGLTIADPVLVSTFTLHNPDDEILQWVRIYLHPDQTTPEETIDLIGPRSAAEPR